MVEGDVVWVGGNTLRIKGYEDVDVCCVWLILFCGGALVRRKGFTEEGGDFVGFPGCGHGVGEVTASGRTVLVGYNTLVGRKGKKGKKSIRRIIHHKNILPLPQPKHKPTLDQLLLPRLPQPGRIATAQTQDLDMVAQLGPGEGQYRWRKEHGFVIGVGDEEADALVAQGWETGGGHAYGVEVEAWEEEGD